MAVKTVKYTFNGQVYTLTKNASTGKYEATITAPGNQAIIKADINMVDL